MLVEPGVRLCGGKVVYLERGKLLSFPVFDNVGLTVDGVIKVFLCVCCFGVWLFL